VGATTGRRWLNKKIYGARQVESWSQQSGGEMDKGAVEFRTLLVIVLKSFQMTDTSGSDIRIAVSSNASELHFCFNLQGSMLCLGQIMSH
jgi:hypothetical protein